jgi:eukaryotic-like serine/threonine-protein kinase
MGIVWRARDELLDRDVAVKEVQMADTLSPDERANAYQRTLREAKTAARLSHPGVVSVYDVADDDGRPWIVMELVHARSLDQVLAVEGPLSPRQTAEIGRQLLAALSVAHRAGVLHRDVKPSNVLLSQEGRAVLTDFGIATFQGDPKLTQTGMVMGSPGFTAPERIRGGDATPASDLWSLGATLYAAVQGHGPYESRGGAITTMSAIINEDAPSAPAAVALSPVIEALLRRDPLKRPDALTASRMISDVVPLLPDRQGGDGYEPTSLSSSLGSLGDIGSLGDTPGGSYDGSATPAAPAAHPAPPALTARDLAGHEQAGLVPDGGIPDPDVTPSTWRTPAASVTPPTMPQPSLDDSPRLVSGFSESSGLGGSTSSHGSHGSHGAEEPDFSSWYSSPKTGSASPGFASAGFASAQQSQRDVVAWPEAPPPGSGRPSGSGGGGSRRLWLLALIALAIIGAGVGAATVMLLRHSDSSKSTGGAAASQSQGTSPTASNPPQSTGNTPVPTVRYSKLDIIQAIDSPSSGPFPSGFTSYTQSASSAGTAAGFSLSYPGTWQVQHSGYQTYFRDPALSAYVLVDLTPHTYPSNMVREATYIKKRSASAHPGYVQIGKITSWPIRNAPGSYWKFTFTDNGVPQEVLDLLWVSSSSGNQSYAMYFTAPYVSWNRLRPVFATIAQSFEPAT